MYAYLLGLLSIISNSLHVSAGNQIISRPRLDVKRKVENLQHFAAYTPLAYMNYLIYAPMAYVAPFSFTSFCLHNYIAIEV